MTTVQEEKQYGLLSHDGTIMRFIKVKSKVHKPSAENKNLSLFSRAKAFVLRRNKVTAEKSTQEYFSEDEEDEDIDGEALQNRMLRDLEKEK